MQQQQQQQQQPQQWGRVKLTEVNPHLVCVLCHGYFIDATTMAECPHSFCRSCIILYLESKSYCPICEVQIHKTKPHLNLKPDKTLQDIVYKLVPGLFHSEMRRRREFYQKHPNRDMYLSPEARGVGIERIIYSPDDSISLSLEYYDKEQEREEWAAARPGEQKPETTVSASAVPENPNGSSSASSSGDGSDSSSSSANASVSAIPKRYLQCPAVVTMRHLKKFIRMKYNLSQACTVELLYRRESLPDSYSLMDVAYIYTWKRNGPMRFYYRIHMPTTVTRVLPPAEPTAKLTELTDAADEEDKRDERPAVETDKRTSEQDDKESSVLTTDEKSSEDKAAAVKKEEPAVNGVADSNNSMLPPPTTGVKRPYDHDPLSVSLLLSLRNGHSKQPVVTTVADTASTPTVTTTTQSQDRRDNTPSKPDTSMTSPSSKTNHHSNGTTTTTTTTVTTTTSTVSATSQCTTVSESVKPAVSKQQTSSQVVNGVNDSKNSESQKATPSQAVFNGNRSANTGTGKPPPLEKINLNKLMQQRNVTKAVNSSNSGVGVRSNGQLTKPKQSEVPVTSSSAQDGSKQAVPSSSSQTKPLTVAEKVLKSAKYMPSTFNNTTTSDPAVNRIQTKEANNSLLNQNNAQSNNSSSSSSSIGNGNNSDKPVAHSTSVNSSDNSDKTEVITPKHDKSPPQHRKEVNRLEQILKESLKRKCLTSDNNDDVNNKNKLTGSDSELKNNTVEQTQKKKKSSEDENKKNEKSSTKPTSGNVEKAETAKQKEEEETARQQRAEGAVIKEADARAESPSAGAASIRDHVAAAPPATAPTVTDTTTTTTSSSSSPSSILKRKLNDPAYTRGLVSFNTSSHDQDNKKKRRLVTPEVSIELTSKPNGNASNSVTAVTHSNNNNNNNNNQNDEGTDFSKLTRKFLESLQQMKRPNSMSSTMTTNTMTTSSTTNEFKFKDVDQLCASTVKIEKVPSSAMMPETGNHLNAGGGLVRASVADDGNKRKADTVEVTIQRVSDETSTHSGETPPKKMPRLIEINAPPRPKLSATPFNPHHLQDRKQQQKIGLKMTTVRKEVPIGKEMPTLVRKDTNGALDLSSGSSTTTTTTTNKIKSSFQRPPTTGSGNSSRSPTMTTSSLAPLLAMTGFSVPEMKSSPPIRVPTLKQKPPVHIQPRPSSLSSSSPSPPAESSRPATDVFSAAAFQQFYRHQLELQNRLLAAQASNNNNNNNRWRQDPVTAKKLEDWMRTVMYSSTHPLMYSTAPESHRK